MNNLTVCPGCEAGIGRADIEESKSNVAMNAWLPQASYPCGNFSDTSCVKFRQTKGSLGHAFAVRIHTENPNQMSFYPYVPHEISVLIELILGHLCYCLTDVPPQPNSPPDTVIGESHKVTMSPRGHHSAYHQKQTRKWSISFNQISETTSRVVVFHLCRSFHLFYTS